MEANLPYGCFTVITSLSCKQLDNEKDENGTGHSKRLDIAPKQLQDEIAAIEETHHQAPRQEGRLVGTHCLALSLELQNDGDGPNDIDDTYEYKKG